MPTTQIIRKINNDLAIAGQVTSTQLQQIALEGYRSVVNLRSPDETDFPNTEQQEVESLGLEYFNIPVRLEGIDRNVALQVLEQIDASAKPALVHCHRATIAAAMALIHVAVHQGISLEQAFQQAAGLGLFNARVYK
jgi:uncharacterized protein (TIGR01244 family)